MGKKSRKILLSITSLIAGCIVFAADSVELVDDPGLDSIEKAKGWWGKSSAVMCKQADSDILDKGKCLFIYVPKKKLAKTVSWQYNSPWNESYGAGTVQIKCRIKTENIKSVQPDYTWAIPYFSLIGHVKDDGKKVYKNFASVKLEADDDAWREYSLRFDIPSNTTDLSVIFILNKCTGKMWIDDFSMKFIPSVSSN